MVRTTGGFPEGSPSLTSRRDGLALTGSRTWTHHSPRSSVTVGRPGRRAIPVRFDCPWLGVCQYGLVHAPFMPSMLTHTVALW